MTEAKKPPELKMRGPRLGETVHYHHQTNDGKWTCSFGWVGSYEMVSRNTAMAMVNLMLPFITPDGGSGFAGAAGVIRNDQPAELHIPKLGRVAGTWHFLEACPYGR